jgi:hypothetical protein
MEMTAESPVATRLSGRQRIELMMLHQRVGGAMGATEARLSRAQLAEKNLLPGYRKSQRAIPYISQAINHATIVRRLVMTTGYVLADLATKVAYFSLTAVAFVFVWMLLTGIHP